MTSSFSGKKTIEQARALAAWNLIACRRKEAAFEDFRRQAKQLPVRIMTAGLGHALAFLEVKDCGGLVEKLSEWIAQRMPPDPAQAKGLLERIVHGDSALLRRATDEVLSFMVWVNRFADQPESAAKSTGESAPPPRSR